MQGVGKVLGEEVLVFEGDKSVSLVFLKSHRHCHFRNTLGFFGGWVKHTHSPTKMLSEGDKHSLGVSEVHQ